LNIINLLRYFFVIDHYMAEVAQQAHHLSNDLLISSDSLSSTLQSPVVIAVPSRCRVEAEEPAAQEKYHIFLVAQRPGWEP